MEVAQYGWSKDEASKTLIPVTTPSYVALAPSSILEVIRCVRFCTLDEPCRSAQCGCEAAYLLRVHSCVHVVGNAHFVGIHSTNKPRKLMNHEGSSDDDILSP